VTRRGADQGEEIEAEKRSYLTLGTAASIQLPAGPPFFQARFMDVFYSPNREAGLGDAFYTGVTQAMSLAFESEEEDAVCI